MILKDNYRSEGHVFCGTEKPMFRGTLNSVVMVITGTRVENTIDIEYSTLEGKLDDCVNAF